MNSYVYCVDNTGVANAKVIQMYGNKKKRVASYGDMVYIVVKSLDKSSGNLLDEKQRKKYIKKFFINYIKEFINIYKYIYISLFMVTFVGKFG